MDGKRKGELRVGKRGWVKGGKMWRWIRVEKGGGLRMGKRGRVMGLGKGVGYGWEKGEE